MSWYRGLLACLGLLAALFLTACADDKGPPDYRYRLTVEVDTPEGLKTGSGVIAVEQGTGISAAGGFSKTIWSEARGEAVAVDLPEGQTLFALLRSGEHDWAAYVMRHLAPEYSGEDWEESFDNMMEMRGEIVLRKYFPRKVLGKPQPAYPMLVTFADLADPASVKRADPDNLPATFGEGYALRRITVQMTNDPVTTGIKKRLRWLTDPSIMENPGWGQLSYNIRSVLIGLRAGKVGSET